MGLAKRLGPYGRRHPAHGSREEFQKEQEQADATMVWGFLIVISWIWYGVIVPVILGIGVTICILFGFATRKVVKEPFVAGVEKPKVQKVQKVQKMQLARNGQGRFVKRK